MTTYVLSLTGDEEKAANATHWAKFRKAKLLSISRNPCDKTATGMTERDSLVITAHGPIDLETRRAETRRAPVTRDPEALAALLVRTLDIQDGAGVVLADFDSEDFAADVVARIAALGRDVTCAGQAASFAFGAGVRARTSQS